MVSRFRVIRYLMHKEVKILLIGQEEHHQGSIKPHHRCQEWEAWEVWEEWVELNNLEVHLQEVCQEDYQLDFHLIFNKWHKIWIQL
jgi:hypothetical protein